MPPFDQDTSDWQEALGQSETFLDFQDQLSRVGPVERPVLIVGERGTGKELAAHRIHFLSRRWQEPFVELNCAGLAPTLIESELFGHEAGAFTGATSRRRGRFEAADGGTLFLDELGNLPLEVQEKLLRVVEYGSFERVGGSEVVRVDVRIVGATNADLVAMSDAGHFMRDLLDRLSFEVLYVPPLRARSEDILLLAEHFATRMAVELGRSEAPEFSEAVEQALCDHPWYGNVRELKNVIERAVYQAKDNYVQAVVFNPFQSPYAPQHRPAETPAPHAAHTVAPPPPQEEEVCLDRPFQEIVSELEIKLLRAGLDRARFNQKKAAELLGLTYHQFRGLYRKYREELEDTEEEGEG
jgi:psp operon transcriptional activator